MRHFITQLVPQWIKNIYHLMMAMGACVRFGFPARTLIVIGVTGTNGKTTTVQCIARILECAGHKAALASTINFQIGEKKWVNDSKFTTLSSWQLQKFLQEAVVAGCKYVVLETSSHALDQNRVWGIPYAIAVLTNVTREHLDYHKTMTRYRKAKQKLFIRAKQAVINMDIPDSEYFSSVLPKTTLLYSTKNQNAHLFSEKIELDFTGTEFVVEGTHFHLQLPGLFNIENALAALGVARLLNIDFSVAKTGLESIVSIPGRMELVPNERKIDILIDYAVTPDAFEKLYASLLPLKIPGTKIIHVFGACGERDRGKRPLLGEIASGYADIIILTNEDPY
ncbi:MAG TPA: UDP-N-acetylmuramoyl-L-alanyl-D-glutamate--2,6-diaminopimelate ligase, partial [Patescibacteria group bacterium]|nr:UDP-N-acetylmuramoyl-L-alanyl-D-glutamate--2,6-diaminopimelate ligase [Patescibacteria group bacterium]